MSGILGLMLLLVVTALLIWIGIEAWRAQSRYLKWGGAGLATLAAAVAAFAGILASADIYRLHARHASAPNIKVPVNSGQIQRGHAIASSFCDSCHSTTDPLVSDFVLTRYFPISIGSFTSPNLTPAGRLNRWSDGEIFRAIRNSIDADGNWLMIMSYTSTGKLSDTDTEAVIAYLRGQQAAGYATQKPQDRLNMLGVIMLGAGMLAPGMPVSTDTITAPPRAEPGNTKNRL